MSNTFFEAVLIDYFTIKISIYSLNLDLNSIQFKLLVNGEYTCDLNIIKKTFFNGIYIFECKIPQLITLGNDYLIQCSNIGTTNLIVNNATTFKNFDKQYYYDGNDLGFTYCKESTLFKLWAPLSSCVFLKIKYKDSNTYNYFKMNRGYKGVYSLKLIGDFDGVLYKYVVTNSGVTFETTDPYAKASTANGSQSAVINFNKINIDLNNEKLSTYDDYADAIVYEISIRDFTIDKNTNIVNKGKFLGLTEENRTTNKGHKAGFDYLKELGVTHIQLMPIFDFKTVDELNPDEKYNWGYDPQQYFVPEGSYSLNPSDPYSRIIELKKLIAKFHENNIKVNMDVVFNHVYDYEFSAFEKVVPNYYFRKNSDGSLCNGSGCGNDLATERPMVRKLIIDCLKFWMNEYGIDGYRFDLMGLIDIDTIKEAILEIKKIKPNAMIYGEGWDMNTNLPHNKKASYLNAFQLKEVAFFNDDFRNIVRGNNDLCHPNGGYILGDISYRDGFKYAYMGSVVDYLYKPKFLDANQSINYVECHDNCTLFDKIVKEKNNLSNDIAMRIVNMANFCVLFSSGVSFIHSGQEIGISKKFHDNTYNEGDEYNKFKYELLDERFNSFLYMKSLIKLKKLQHKYGFIRINPTEIKSSKSFKDLENGGLLIKSVYTENNNNRNFIVAINPTGNPIHVYFDEYYQLVIGDGGYLQESNIFVQNGVISPYSINAFVKK